MLAVLIDEKALKRLGNSVCEDLIPRPLLPPLPAMMEAKKAAIIGIAL